MKKDQGQTDAKNARLLNQIKNAEKSDLPLKKEPDQIKNRNVRLLNLKKEVVKIVLLLKKNQDRIKGRNARLLIRIKKVEKNVVFRVQRKKKEAGVRNSQKVKQNDLRRSLLDKGTTSKDLTEKKLLRKTGIAIKPNPLLKMAKKNQAANPGYLMKTSSTEAIMINTLKKARKDLLKSR